MDLFFRRILMALAFCVACGANCLSASSSRYAPVVLLRGADFPEGIGKPIANLAFFTGDPSADRGIRFQVDRRDEEGRYAPLPSNALLDASDEVSLPWNELAEGCPTGGGGYGVYSIAAGKHVYPTRCVAIGPLRERQGLTSAVAYSAKEDKARTPYYEAVFGQKNPFLIEQLRWGSPSIPFAPNSVDRMKFRVTAHLLGMIPWRRSENDLETSRERVIMGPVRTIREVKIRVKFLFFFTVKEFYANYILYPDHLSFSCSLNVPFALMRAFADLELKGGLDFAMGSKDAARYFDRHTSAGIPLAEFPNATSKHPSSVMALGTAQGLAVSAISGFSGTPVGIYPLARYTPHIPDPPERVPGEAPGLYFIFRNILAYPHTKLTFSIDNFIFPPSNSPDIKSVVASLYPIFFCSHRTVEKRQ